MWRLTHRDASFGVLSFLAAALLFLPGCRAAALFTSSNHTLWSGMGVSFPLPTGTWKVVETDDIEGRHFASEDGARHLVVMRKPAKQNVPPWLALRNIFLEFREKELTARQTLALADGSAAEVAEYAVTLEGGAVRMSAAVVPKGPDNYLFIAWNSADGPPPPLEPILYGFTRAAPEGGKEKP